jgi:DNA-directed RNA polymerase specialized sigma subunit
LGENKIGWCALALCIIKNWRPEKSLYYIETGKKRNHFTERDYKAMVAYKKMGLSYKEIGDLFGISRHHAHLIIRNQSDKLSQRAL